MNTTNSFSIKALNYILITLISFGFVGNFFIFRIYSTLRKYSISTYFRAVAIFDSLMLVNGIIYFLYINFNFDLSILNIVTCKLRDYLVYVHGAISPWIVVIISVDRFMSIRFPRRFPLIFKLKFQMCVISAIVCFCYIFYIPMIWGSFIVEGKNNFYLLKIIVNKTL